MQETFTLKQIYNMLSTQSFLDWYQNDFTDHMECAVFSKPPPEILEDIEALLN